jgi:hypothetical protein
MRYVTSTRHLETGACENCGYQGWAFPQAIRLERHSRRKRKGRLTFGPAPKTMDRRWV